jgi:hydroxymethylglutaryl-CoA reductase (NADPH)
VLVPRALLRQLYTTGSLRNTEQGVVFSMKNRLSDAQVTRLRRVSINGTEIPLETLRVRNGDRDLTADRISERSPLPFPLRHSLDLLAPLEPLGDGRHRIEIAFDTTPFGRLTMDVADEVSAAPPAADRVPRDESDDFAASAIEARHLWLERRSGARLDHVRRYSFDPHVARGNCEQFVGVAQVPIGLAGPLLIDGEHARGEFVVPLATSEGTLVASYNRGMRVLSECGGVRCTVSDDAMQRAPVFVFADARDARDFADWIPGNLERIRGPAEATSRVARLLGIECYLSNRFAFLRFNYSTGDAAGQNMVTRATLAACGWIVENYAGIERFFLEANVATDKKASHINTLQTRGKRVTAEAVISREVLQRRLRVDPETLAYHGRIANVGAMISGATNNGLHSANGITALFIATGQDVANVAESSTGLIYAEIMGAGDLYLSITIPSLIVATHGGGTGLPTQNECLRLLGCAGPGTVRKFAEIVAATVLAGELSLAAAISSLEWVSSHEAYGRNR